VRGGRQPCTARDREAHGSAAFFTLSRHLYPGKYAPTRTHHFLAQLQARERNCLSVWTQNVDTLERLAGVEADSLIEAHGSFAGNACIDCHAEQPEPWMKEHCLAGTVARCPRKKCRRGIVKPNIVCA
jgi:NAD-dependent SIR2 family protein deacetylase